MFIYIYLLRYVCMYMVTIPQPYVLHYIFMVGLYVNASPVITSGGPPFACRPTCCTAQCCGTAGCVSSAKTCLCVRVRAYKEIYYISQ